MCTTESAELVAEVRRLFAKCKQRLDEVLDIVADDILEECDPNGFREMLAEELEALESRVEEIRDWV